MNLHEEATVRCIRAILCHELYEQFSYRFFWLDYLPGETPDEALLRLFRQERPHHDSDFEAVLALC